MKITFYALLFFTFLKCYAQDSNEPKVLYNIAGMENAQVKYDIAYVEEGDSSLVMDIYYPAEFDFNSKIPVIVIAFGYSGSAQQKLIGKPFMKWKWYTSWCKLIAAKGMAAIVYETTSPKEDLNSIQNYLVANASKLNIDLNKVGLFSISGNASVALEAIMEKENNFYKCGALYYPFIVSNDSELMKAAVSVSTEYGFSLVQLPERNKWQDNTPLFIVQAGKDKINRIKELLGEFIHDAHKVNMPLTFVNYKDGIHGFDVFQNSNLTKKIIEDTLDFWVYHLITTD